MSGDTPELEEFDSERAPPVEAWKASPEIEEISLNILQGVLPTELRATEKDFEEFYQQGYNLYKAGQFKEALPFFHLLAIANVKEPRYSMAIAACYHMLKDYKEAASYYTLCSALDANNPLPFYHLADCLTKQGQPFPALVSLTMAHSRCTPPKFSALKDRIALMMERLDKELLALKAQGNVLRTSPTGQNILPLPRAPQGPESS